ncbi:MAG: hypothetical protein LBC18_01260 [Opitutaceae bacterium]|jgi:hypothetical protein|nr:hypothetical protein [Opitutaceae bacterium]
MNQTRCFSLPPLFAALFAVFLLPGCAKTPEDHARIAMTHASHENRVASVEALATANNQALLADVAAYAGDKDIRSFALEKSPTKKRWPGLC